MEISKRLKENNTFEMLNKVTGYSSRIGSIVASLSIGTPKELDIDLLNDFPDHTYTTYDDKKLDSLAKSIEQSGLAQPILVWHKKNEDKYYILAGHNRTRACRKIGYRKISCIIKEDITEDEANLLVNTNMDQRGLADYSLYDKCKSIIKVLNATKNLAKLNKLKSYNELIENNEANEVALYFGLQKSQIQKLKILGESLSKEWFNLYPKNWDINGGICLTRLSKDDLNYIYSFIINNPNKKIKITEKNGKLLQNAKSHEEMLDIILNNGKPAPIKNEIRNENTSSDVKESNKDVTKKSEDDQDIYIVNLNDIEFKDIMTVLKNDFKSKEDVYTLVKTVLSQYLNG